MKALYAAAPGEFGLAERPRPAGGVRRRGRHPISSRQPESGPRPPEAAERREPAGRRWAELGRPLVLEHSRKAQGRGGRPVCLPYPRPADPHMGTLA